MRGSGFVAGSLNAPRAVFHTSKAGAGARCSPDPGFIARRRAKTRLRKPNLRDAKGHCVTALSEVS